MAATRMTVAEAVFLLMQADPLEEIEFDVVAKVTVTPVASLKKVVKKNIFEAEELSDPADAEVNDLVYLDYGNPGEGPITRVGFVLANDHGSLLVYDLSVDGVRRFDHDFVEDIFLLS